MARLIHKQKSPLGGDVYLDENFKVIGYGQKGPFGEEVLLDKDFKYAGRKRKGPGSGETVILDGGQPGRREPAARRGTVGAWIFLAAVLGLIVWFVASIVK